MKIPSTGVPALPATTPIHEATGAAPATATATATATAANAGSERQSAILQTAQAALREMPEIDEARVAALRDALARGEVHFDAAKLAGLISRYHGGRE